jgi:hypothetical protein
MSLLDRQRNLNFEIEYETYFPAAVDVALGLECSGITF